MILKALLSSFLIAELRVCKYLWKFMELITIIINILIFFSSFIYRKVRAQIDFSAL